MGYNKWQTNLCLIIIIITISHRHTGNTNPLVNNWYIIIKVYIHVYFVNKYVYMNNQ